MAVPAFNSVAWFEFGTDQPEKVKEFYGELFDWSYALNTNTPGVTYHSVMPPGAQQPAGGVWESEGKFADSAGLTFARLQDTAGNHFGIFSVPAP
ncbi:VOC family protein [Streptomyces scabiei]|uniref:VOC family protein n=1 Tax=Streptomyces TaxID=1883 RepID=UPI0029B5AFEF|nr:VOC family protein [Streptomyces sp. ND04-05B]MDX3069030.1 VOC family protein [Streptomyces sp. ND04-05B]